ncbi:MAG TPA: DUF881 domain-containing protein, partial [Ruminiclostridium sp.]|nr:DUF881 domain-containing protein [Ruminiclostridium sp.]
ELKMAGAQALSVNGERIISTSEQVCAGPQIFINNNRYPVPYEIKAIGDPDKLEKNISESETMASLLECRIRVSITKSRELTISRYIGDISKLISALEVEKK